MRHRQNEESLIPESERVALPGCPRENDRVVKLSCCVKRMIVDGDRTKITAELLKYDSGSLNAKDCDQQVYCLSAHNIQVPHSRRVFATKRGKTKEDKAGERGTSLFSSQCDRKGGGYLSAENSLYLVV